MKADPTEEKEPPLRPPSLLKLPLNEKGRDWFVGDMHGEFELLQRFMKRVRFNKKKDRLIAVGDLVDRGPESGKLLELFGNSPTWFFSVLGNHDAMMREAWIYGSWDASRVWGHNGGAWAEKVDKGVLATLRAGLLRMPLAIEAPLYDGRRVGVVHAEVSIWSQWAEVKDYFVGGDEACDAGTGNDTDVIWGRSRIPHALVVRKDPDRKVVNLKTRSRALQMLAPVAGIDLVVMGHTRLNPMIPLPVSNMLWIDTGGGYTGGRLTFVDLAAGEYLQVSHDNKVHRRKKLPPTYSLEHWKLTPEQEEEAKSQQSEEELKNIRLLELFGIYGPDRQAATMKKKDG